MVLPKKRDGTGFEEEAFLENPFKNFLAPIDWLAPEVLKCKMQKKIFYSTKSDIYMFGMFMFEIFERKQGPFPNKPDGQALIDGRLRPQFLVTPTNYRKVIKKCWDQDPNKRPNIDLLLQWLRDLEEDTNRDPTGSPTNEDKAPGTVQSKKQKTKKNKKKKKKKKKKKDHSHLSVLPVRSNVLTE
eukprot:g24763.t1